MPESNGDVHSPASGLHPAPRCLFRLAKNNREKPKGRLWKRRCGYMRYGPGLSFMAVAGRPGAAAPARLCCVVRVVRCCVRCCAQCMPCAPLYFNNATMQCIASITLELHDPTWSYSTPTDLGGSRVLEGARGC